MDETRTRDTVVGTPLKVFKSNRPGGHVAMTGHGQPWPVLTVQGSVSVMHGPWKLSQPRGLAGHGAVPVVVISAFDTATRVIDASTRGSRSGTGP